jgi:DNA replication and repair protein RecF
VHLHRLWLQDFRCYTEAELTFDDGLTAVVGANGEGKSSLLEAVGYLAWLKSFRGVPTEALVRQGASSAVVRAEGTSDGRSLLIEAEITTTGRNRVQVNRQRLQRARDLMGALRVSVFSPDDLELIKGGPALRRGFCDDTLMSLSVVNHQLRADFDKVLRQRNTLLKQAKGRLSDDVAITLDVWDTQFARLGDELAARRVDLLTQLNPLVKSSYDAVAGTSAEVTLSYDPPWAHHGLGPALAAGRADDIRRGVTLVGPHRDDLELSVAGMPGRTHASQGEQRSAALALRLAAHHLVSDATNSSPVLLLDDVFSELDPQRSDALVRALPPGQTLLTTAGTLPPGIEPGRVVTVRNGTIVHHN